MQPLSAPKSDLLFLSYLFHLKFDHYPERLSDDVILRREPKNLERVSNLSDKILRFAQNDGRRHSVGCRTVFPVYFREKEMQNQRHEVCLNYKRIGVLKQQIG